MKPSLLVLGEALMDCVMQADGRLLPLMGGSPFNLARAAALRGASVAYVNPISIDPFGQQLRKQLSQDGVQTLLPASRLPTSLAVVHLNQGQPSYGFYRKDIADRDYQVDQVLAALAQYKPGVLHTGSLMLVPPEHEKIMAIARQAKAQGWTLSVDVNLRPQVAADLGHYVNAVWKLAALADWIKASDEDLALLGFVDPARDNAAQTALRFTQHGASRVALSYGAAGAWLEVDGVQASLTAPAVTVVDSVGAGDTFWGNCLGDWVLQPQGAAQRVDATLRQAMLAAAINCARAGCQPPTYAEVQGSTLSFS